MSTSHQSTRVRRTADARPEPRITFTFEGRQLQAAVGDTVAAALIANGIQVFGRSSKYHRPRGYRCGRGHCSCCAMRVDGLPGVRTCVTTVQPGMRVEREHAWPTVDHDLLRASELLSPLMPPGFYYRWFKRSPRLWGAFERRLTRVAGQGDMPSREAVAKLAAARCRRRGGVDVLVVGGGVAGMSAALAAADEGATVLLVQRGDRLGGRAADDTQAAADAAGLVSRIEQQRPIEVLVDAEAVGWYEEDTIAVDTHPDLLLVDPGAVVLATGAYELGPAFANCDLPGVMLAGGAQRLLSRFGVRPGSTAVFIACGDFAYEAALHAMTAGIRIACLADCRWAHEADQRLVAALTSKGVTTLAKVSNVRANGVNRVTSLSLTDARGETRRYRCDVVCVSAGFRAADELAHQVLSQGQVTLSVPEPVESAPGEPTSHGPRGPWLAGQVCGTESFAAAVEQGAAVGRAAAGAARALRSPA